MPESTAVEPEIDIPVNVSADTEDDSREVVEETSAYEVMLMQQNSY